MRDFLSLLTSVSRCYVVMIESLHALHVRGASCVR